MRKLGKKYVEASSKIEKGKLYDVAEAVSLAKQTSTTKFDSSVEVAMHLNIDTKNAHRALQDCYMTFQIMKDIKQKLNF